MVGVYVILPVALSKVSLNSSWLPICLVVHFKPDLPVQHNLQVGNTLRVILPATLDEDP